MTYLRIEDGGLECHEYQEEEILPGFRFHPTDEELVDFYLRSKVMKKKIKLEIIKEIDIYKFDPWDLPSFNNLESEDNEWYFFCLRGRKYKNSVRPNRVTGSGFGFWKATGIDKPVYSTKENHCIGLKKSLVYYRGSAGKGTKTDWMMHEFRLPPGNSGGKPMHEAEIWTICRIFKRNISYRNHQSQYHQTQLKPNPRSSNSSSQNRFECEDHQKALENSEVVNENKMSSPSQTSSVLTSSGVDTDECIEDVNWDELGRILDIVLEPSAFEFCP